MEALRNVSVFFEFDSATLTSEAREKLSAVGNVLARYPDLKVRVEGNCDERGTEQYNLALGQRRADSAKRYLTDLGVKPPSSSPSASAPRSLARPVTTRRPGSRTAAPTSRRTRSSTSQPAFVQGFQGRARDSERILRTSSASAGAQASTSAAPGSAGDPSNREVIPPASATSTSPAATSHGLRPCS